MYNSRTGNVGIYTRNTVKEFKIDTEVKEKEGIKHELEAKRDHDTINSNYTIGKRKSNLMKIYYYYWLYEI